ncbi:MAG TPA: hypothetical protein VL576_01755 [Candidatus Paceibacterota bacterium]|jgi:hypothetical protein|nr:hypothetical protein [Candidatus Paceibacterota bacterium]
MEQNNTQNGNGSSSKSNSKNLIIAAIAIIVVIAVAIAIPHFKHSGSEAAPVDTVSATDTSGTQSTDGSAVASLAAWNALFSKYEGHLVVFGSDCRATPETQSQTKGSTVLLMNNGNTPHTFVVGGTTYSVGAYHYKTFMLNNGGNVLINCDGKATASITVQG